MKNIKSNIIVFFCTLLIPINVLAYSNKIILGGDNIGIKIQNNGVIVIGFYKNTEANEKFEIGDIITKVNGNNISSIKELTNEIENNIKNDTVNITYIRDKKEYITDLKLIKDDNRYKTGLYVKDTIKGIGTLTYIDPETKIYGSLGHEILESNSKTKINVKDGYIFQSSITDINKSYNGNPGEKNASYNSNNIYGTIDKNTIYGIFGKYNSDIKYNTLIEVANKDEIKTGDAYIYTVLNNNDIKKYKINIKSINEKSSIKNISFEIIDEELLDKAGGIVQGMSGSPIVQNDKIIGVVTHVVIDKVNTGYGLFITTMLEEGDKNI